jgi:hypothetical protein
MLSMTAPDPSPPNSGEVEIACDLLVAGAGLGGCAASLFAAQMGHRVCVIEETGWPGGQISVQGNPAFDEHQYIETFGGTRSYYRLRDGIREYYRAQYTLAAAAAGARELNPGNAWVSRLSFEPRAGVAVLEAMMSQFHESGDLQLFYHTKAVAAEVYDGRVASVLTRQLETGMFVRFRAKFVLDATDLGDLLVFTATAYRVGQESRAETGEPSAPPDADRGCVQNFTFPVAVDYRPGENHTIPKPEGYERNRDTQPYTLNYRPWIPGDPPYRVFEKAPQTGGPFWTYRRALDAKNFTDSRVDADISILNWTGNDFRGGPVVDRLPPEPEARYREARLLTLGFLYWLQTEAPRDDGGAGYPGMRPRPDVMGSPDGVSQMPYVREGRRMRALYTIVEQDVAAASHPASRAARFDDAVGIGFYPIDLHGCGQRTIDIVTKPFQIPLGALVPQRTTNLLPAAKNIGTTHLTNGAYRLHPVEWAIGEASGAAASLCLREEISPQRLAARAELVRRLQLSLLDQGVPAYWYDDVPLQHPAFGATQLLAVEGAWTGNDADLHFSPDATLGHGEGKRRIAAAAERIRHWRGAAAADPNAAVLQPAPEDDVLPLRRGAAATLIAVSVPGTPGLEPIDQDAPEAAQVMTRADLAIWLAQLLRVAIEPANQ